MLCQNLCDVSLHVRSAPTPNSANGKFIFLVHTTRARCHNQQALAQVASASSTEWVIRMIVFPVFFQISNTKLCIFSRVSSSKAPKWLVHQGSHQAHWPSNGPRPHVAAYRQTFRRSSFRRNLANQRYLAILQLLRRFLLVACLSCLGAKADVFVRKHSSIQTKHHVEKTMPRSGPGARIWLPDNVMVPSVGAKKPASIFSNVDLPHPEGPSTDISSPSLMFRIDVFLMLLLYHRLVIRTSSIHH